MLTATSVINSKTRVNTNRIALAKTMIMNGTYFGQSIFSPFTI